MPSLLHPLNLPQPPAACTEPDLSQNSGPPPSGRPPWLRLLGSALGTRRLPTPPVTLSPEQTPERLDLFNDILARNIAEEPGCKSVVCHWRQLLLRARGQSGDDSPTPGCRPWAWGKASSPAMSSDGCCPRIPGVFCGSSLSQPLSPPGHGDEASMQKAPSRERLAALLGSSQPRCWTFPVPPAASAAGSNLRGPPGWLALS